MTHHPRKRFGQNFLIDKTVIQKIVNALAPKSEDFLVEIGAGLGALTMDVLLRVPHLTVIEIDRDLSEQLRQTYPKEMTLYNQDALEFDFSAMERPLDQKMRVFGNLPYNISTPLLFHLLHYAPIISDLLFMLQKEVVLRMCAAAHTADYGRLSVMIQYACQVQRLFDIDPSSFSPAPKVMSSVVKLIPYGDNRPHPLATDYKHFANLVNVAFQHRRKTLRNALRDLVSPMIFSILQIDPIRRPETLTIAEYVALSNAVVAE